MPAGSYDITIEQGATFQLSITWKDADDNPIDLTGYTARMQVRRRHRAEDPALLSLTTENGAITLGGAAGTISIVASATSTDDLPAKPCVYDIELISPGSIVYRVLEGAADVTPEVTR
jgi:hypothetical protein